MQHQFPDLHLEGKVVNSGGSDDRDAGRQPGVNNNVNYYGQVYSRKRKQNIK
ncbi:unnamed protein product [Cuscuta epithymum]|uniref:Uncharacterized protein n=1 Tax=Cuscuta epithymum TaxID=186058 RepID=A0AAV0DBI3_9ASTE|nr:unnamed protein product [Cuscuta epithymum]